MLLLKNEKTLINKLINGFLKELSRNQRAHGEPLSLLFITMGKHRYALTIEE